MFCGNVLLERKKLTIWEDALQEYRTHGFLVFTREDLFAISLDDVIETKPISPSTVAFLRCLSRPTCTLWDAFFTGILTVHNNMPETAIFPPFRYLIDHTVQIAVLYGEHPAKKSPDRWSYLLGIRDENRNKNIYCIAHAPASSEHIREAETILEMKLPLTYTSFLQCTNGLELDLHGCYFVSGVGRARARLDEVLSSPNPAAESFTYHEIASYNLMWQSVLQYERQRDQETGINTFLSDERVCVPFASTYDDWCFDRSCAHENNEYPILFWDHESRQATWQYPDFETWFVHEVFEDE